MTCLSSIQHCLFWKEHGQLFNSIERSKVHGYHDFMKAIILEAISRHNFTFDELNTFLFNHNKEIFEHVCEKAIAYFDDYAPKSLKSCGN